MSTPRTKRDVLEREFLEVRAKILEIASALDRLDRADGALANDVRLKRIADGLAALQSSKSDRAEQVQLLFSLPYDETWRKKYDV
jgi:hypothetical protein